MTARSTSSGLMASPELIVEFLRTAKAGALFEIRALGHGKPASGYFTDPEVAAQAVASWDKRKRPKAFYFTINEIDEACQSRCWNEIQFADDTTSDKDVTRRTNLYADFDVQRPTGAGTTDEQVELAENLAFATANYMMNEFGWPKPHITMTGNGASALWPCDLPNDDTTTNNVKTLLRGMRILERDDVVVDQSVFNAARITKLPGTVNRKGADLPEYPHRIAEVRQFADGQITAEQFEAAVAAFQPTATEIEEQEKRRKSRKKWSGPTFRDFAAEHGIIFDSLPWSGGEKHLIVCPFDASHDGSSCAILDFGDGFAFKCLHNSCAGHNTRDFIENYDPDYYARKHSPNTPSRDHRRDEFPVEPPALIVRRLSEVPRRPIDWLWQYHLQRAAVNMIVAEQGKGKSTVALDFVARVSTGNWFPGESRDGPRRKPQNVVMVICEDDVADTIGPRVDAAMGDSSRIYVIEKVRDREGRNLQFNIKRDVAEVAKFVAELGDVGILVIDPLGAFLGRVDSHRHSEVYDELSPLVGLSQDQKLATLLIHHFNKAGDTKALNRAMGSAAFTALMRQVWTVAAHPEAQDDRDLVFAHVKHNACPRQPAFPFRIEQNGEIGYVAWGTETLDMSADEVLAAAARSDEDKSQLRKAMEWLEEMLWDGPKFSKDVTEQGRAEGYSTSTLDRARQELKVKASRSGKKWTIWLPATHVERISGRPSRARAPQNVDDDDVLGVLDANDAPSPSRTSSPSSLSGDVSQNGHAPAEQKLQRRKAKRK